MLQVKSYSGLSTESVVTHVSPPTSFEIIASNLVWGIINAVEFDLTDRFLISYVVHKIFLAEIEKRYFKP